MLFALQSSAYIRMRCSLPIHCKLSTGLINITVRTQQHRNQNFDIAHLWGLLHIFKEVLHTCCRNSQISVHIALKCDKSTTDPSQQFSEDDSCWDTQGGSIVSHPSVFILVIAFFLR